MGIKLKFLLLPLLIDHVSGWNSGRVGAEVSHSRRRMRFYEATVTGVSGMGEIYSRFRRAAAGRPGTGSLMRDLSSDLVLWFG